MGVDGTLLSSPILLHLPRSLSSFSSFLFPFLSSLPYLSTLSFSHHSVISHSSFFSLPLHNSNHPPSLLLSCYFLSLHSPFSPLYLLSFFHSFLLSIFLSLLPPSLPSLPLLSSSCLPSHPSPSLIPLLFLSSTSTSLFVSLIELLQSFLIPPTLLLLLLLLLPPPPHTPPLLSTLRSKHSSVSLQLHPHLVSISTMSSLSPSSNSSIPLLLCPPPPPSLLRLQHLYIPSLILSPTQ